MDSLEIYRRVIEKVFKEYAQIPFAHGNVETQLILEHQGDHYFMLAIGWDGPRRIHGCIVHIDIIDGKIWIQRDGIEHGIAEDLENAGIPKDKIVLGFHPADLRKHTGYAVA